jgi:hypothetical protein
MEFRGVVNINEKGEVVCFCSEKEALQGKCLCQTRDNCPDAIISIEVIPGTRPSEKGVKKVAKATKDITKEVVKIKEGLSRLEQAVKKTKFRI